MNDEVLRTRFESCTLDPADFPHREHVHPRLDRTSTDYRPETLKSDLAWRDFLFPDYASY